jgi:hypothetical protein
MAGDVNLAWDPNTEPTLAGYKLYYGTAPRTYDTSIDVGNVTTYTITGLTPGVTYYFAATAYDTNGSESDFSNEVSTTVTCTYSISPASQSFVEVVGLGAVNVTAGSGCLWTAVSNVTWITITAGSSGTGIGTVSYSVEANASTASRSGTLTIGGQTFTVNQAGGPCTYSISPTSQSFGHTGGTGTVNVTAETGCSWTATSNASWITVTSGASDTDNGTATYAVAANTTTSSRSSTLTVAGQTFAVSQAAAPCTYTISPTGQSFSTSGGSGTVNVTAPSGCSWTAVKNTGWITITSGSSGNGNGVATYTVAVNNSKNTRTGTMTIAGRTFTVTQKGK